MQRWSMYNGELELLGCVVLKGAQGGIQPSLEVGARLRQRNGMPQRPSRWYVPGWLHDIQCV